MPIETRDFDVQNYLKTPEDQAAYIEAALKEGDPSFIAAALGDIARARGVTAFAAETGLSREAIYKAFKPGGNPTLETLAKATKALGLRLSVVAA
ncbi:addiction module antidote protein [Bosea sp. (in: a-proteobacteria)]|uniref:addiction module antidote protein n=1 Tax=Bosea sp. (in: a-proteobacteria) TaxID=1871050 RepID=UPI002735F5C0|nr:addiction module antidote protein [Bosea sp. (in: a-proteobacteria)]MDP3409302.1 putative addiction module antidote protein [Bosea sp. (in: a-proteobacteria)]